jgi:uncharacterized protein (DUF169 family)
MINQLKNKFGHKCSAININGYIPKINEAKKKLKLCQAINYSFKLPININKENLECRGAKRSLGFEKNEEMLASFISGNTKIPISFINEAFANIPVMTGINHVNLGISEVMEKNIETDLYIVYIKPVKVTEIMLSLAKHKLKPVIPGYSLLSVCGNVLANSYVNDIISLSFGCPDSRKHGGIEEQEVVIGIPAKQVKYLLN